MAWISKAEQNRRPYEALATAKAEWRGRNALEPGQWIIKNHKRAPYWTCERGTPMNVSACQAQATPPHHSHKFRSDEFVQSFAA